MHLAAVFYYSDLYRKLENTKCMQEKYHYSNNDFYKFQVED